MGRWKADELKHFKRREGRQNWPHASIYTVITIKYDNDFVMPPDSPTILLRVCIDTEMHVIIRICGIRG
jgi:hypothetical protein